jgi:hypothetical protein
MSKTATYSLIASNVLGSAQANVTFSSIPGTFTDLIIVYVATASTGNPDMTAQINGDTATNYSATRLTGNGTAASSARYSTQSFCRFDEFAAATTTAATTGIVSVMDYSNATTYKTLISRSNQAALGVEAFVNLWRSTAAITSLAFAFTSGNIAAGSTFKLYGIQAGSN